LAYVYLIVKQLQELQCRFSPFIVDMIAHLQIRVMGDVMQPHKEDIGFGQMLQCGLMALYPLKVVM
jgi:hypothetical protein